MKKILISTGGSGGHVIPALNIYEHLKDKFQVSITTDFRGKKFINQNKYKYDVINIPKFSGNVILKFITFFVLLFAVIKSYRYLKLKKIKIIFSTGGYMSLPLCIAGILTGAKIYLFEPNMVLGKSNKFFLKYCKKIICYNKDIKNYPKKYNNKILLIEPILNKNTYEAIKADTGNIKSEISLLILGGSQGAEFFDNIILKISKVLSKKFKFKITQQVSKKENFKLIKNFYIKNKIKHDLFVFEENISTKMSKSNIAITRCGASTINELVQLNLPFIGVPYPYSTDDHQFFNVKSLVDKNCCWLIKQNENVVDSIIKILEDIVYNTENYKKKIKNLNKISYQNTWNNINKKIVELINEY